MSSLWKSVTAVILGLGLLVAGFYAGQVSPNILPFETSAMAASSGTLREIWVLPLAPEGSKQKIAKTKRLLVKMNETLNWYANTSGNRTVFIATRVLETVKVPRAAKEEGSLKDDCSPLEEAVKTAAKQAPDGVTVVGIVSGEWKCEYGGLAGIGDDWALALGYSPSPLHLPERTIIHELGHTLGLGHAKVSLCPILSSEEWVTNPMECSTKEYGDAADPMGGHQTVFPPSFNALNLHYLGWEEELDKPLIISEPGDTTVFLPALTLPGPNYMALPDNLYVSYRSGTAEHGNPDNPLGNNANRETVEGVYVYTTVWDAEKRINTSVSLPFLDNRQGGQAGEHYVSAGGNVAFRIDRIMEGRGVYLTVRIPKNEGTVTDDWGPTVATMVQRISAKSALLHWAGFDPSGISHCTVQYDGEVFNFSPQEGQIQLKLHDKNIPQNVTVTVTDMEGNSTVKIVDLRKSTIREGLR